MTQIRQEISNNRSLLQRRLEIVRIDSNSGGFWSSDAVNSASLTVDGNSASIPNFAYDFRTNYTKIVYQDEIWINHNSDGTKRVSGNGSITIRSGLLGSGSVSGYLDLTRIPRATDPTVNPSTLNFGSATTIVLPRASSSFLHGLYYRIGSGNWVQIANGIATSYTWTIPLSLMINIPNSTSLNLQIAVETFSGDTHIGTKTTNLIATVPENIRPSFTTISHSEANVAVSSKIGSYVSRMSRLNMAIEGATGAYGSTIVSYRINYANQLLQARSGTTQTIVVLGDSHALGIVVDSRGREFSKEVLIPALAYDFPVIDGKPIIIRCDSSGEPSPTGTYVKINFSAKVSSLVTNEELNRLSYRILARESNAGQSTEVDSQTLSGLVYPPIVSGRIPAGSAVRVRMNAPMIGGGVPAGTVYPDPRMYNGIVYVYRDNSDGFDPNMYKGVYVNLLKDYDNEVEASKNAGIFAQDDIIMSSDLFYSPYPEDYSYTFTIEVSDIFNRTAFFAIVPIGQTTMHWTKDAVSFGKLIPDETANIFAATKGIKSDGPILQAGTKVANGFVGSLPSGDANSGAYWRGIKAGQYRTGDAAHISNSKGSYAQVLVWRDISDEPGSRHTRVQWMRQDGGLLYGTVNESTSSMTWANMISHFNIKQYILDTTYPIGTVYQSTVNNSPANFLGGTWERFSSGRVLVGVNESDADFNAPHKYGGAKVHYLTEAQLPSHRHPMRKAWSNSGGPETQPIAGWDKGTNYAPLSYTEYAGGGQAHNNMQPYYTVYMWRRTA